jgi:mono/diheme cytochrome c family protein
MRHLALIAALILGGCSKEAAPPAPKIADGKAIPSEPDAKLASGPEGTYARTCGYCHGKNVGPVILGRGLPAETIIAMVRNGKGTMPAFRPTEISDAELATLGEWISKSKSAAHEYGN